MTSGAPDHTIKIYLEKALGFEDKVPTYEVAPVSGRYYATPPTLTDEAFGPALLDSSGRLIVKVHSITTWPSDYPDAAVATLLGGGLPAALDGTDLKVKEQSPITDFPDSAVATLLGGGLPAALDGTDLKVKEQSPITDFPDSAVATLLGGGLPAALDGTDLKVKEQSPITDFPDSAVATLLATPTTITGGQNADVDTTAEQLVVASTPCESVIIQAHKDNTDVIYIGGATNQYVELEAKESVPIDISNVNLVYVKGGAVNQKVNYFYVT